MTQSVITQNTVEVLIAKAEGVVSRSLTDMEKALMEYAVEQIRLGLVEVN
jgi:hypothetical protein